MNEILLFKKAFNSFVTNTCIDNKENYEDYLYNESIAPKYLTFIINRTHHHEIRM